MNKTNESGFHRYRLNCKQLSGFSNRSSVDNVTDCINHFVFALSGRACQMFSFGLKPLPLILDVDPGARITANSRDVKVFVVLNSIGSPFRMQDQVAAPCLQDFF